VISNGRIDARQVLLNPAVPVCDPTGESRKEQPVVDRDLAVTGT
jgi:hypothetical protein